MSYDEAYERVMKCRTINPNVGFVYQLKCFERMKFTFDPSSDDFKAYLSQFSMFIFHLICLFLKVFHTPDLFPILEHHLVILRAVFVGILPEFFI